MKSDEIPYPIIVKTFAGLEEVLAEELKNLGVENPEILKRAVGFTGDNKMLYKVNYRCSTAVRVLKQIESFTFTDNEEFYKKIKAIAWEDYLNADGTLAVDAFESDSIFNNSLFIARFTKDAIVDRFREKFNSRPNIDLTSPDLKVNIHINRTIYCLKSHNNRNFMCKFIKCIHYFFILITIFVNFIYGKIT